MPAVDVSELIERARAGGTGSVRAVARLVSLVEGGGPQVREVMALLADHTGPPHSAPSPSAAFSIGLTGSPGVGKSTTTAALVSAYRQRGLRVGVLAVDPSSPFSGGALLGDRVRMQDVALDPGVYIRSMATRGHLGGLARATPQALRVLEAAGCDIVLIETVGVGQSEVEVAALADTTVVLLAPGMGDGIQAAKAGILEVGDIFAVNKADRDGADATVREISHMLGLGERREAGQWRPPVVKTVATRADGSDELVEAIDKRQAWLLESTELRVHRVRRAAREIEAIVLDTVRSRVRSRVAGGAGGAEGTEGAEGAEGLEGLAGAVVDGRLDAYAAADQLLVGVAVDPTLSSSTHGQT